MKTYHTFVFEITDNSGGAMAAFLKEQGIKFTMGADFSHELIPFGYQINEDLIARRAAVLSIRNDEFVSQYLIHTFVILGDEDDLTALKLRFDGVSVIQNRSYLNYLNFFRRCFRWFLKDSP